MIPDKDKADESEKPQTVKIPTKKVLRSNKFIRTKKYLNKTNF